LNPRFHTGEPVTTKDVVATLNRWMKRDLIGRKLAQFTNEVKPVDDRTFTIVLKEPYTWVEYSLGNQAGNFPGIMREKEAMTDPFTAITEYIGSGVYKFVKEEWKPGAQIVYAKNTDYIPRTEAPDGMAGAKLAKVDRMIWKVMPDVQTAAQALIRGEIDFLDFFPNDLIPVLEKSPDIVVGKVPPVGNFGFLRTNALVPPFNNVKARQALALAIDQNEILAVYAGNDPRWKKECYAFYVCGAAYGTEAGSEPWRKRDIEKAKQLLRESGYKGEKVVMLGTREIPQIGAIAEGVTAALKQIGMNVELEMPDWGTLLGRITSNKRPVGEQGAWSIFANLASWGTWHNPLTNLGTAMTNDESNWAGWAADEEAEKLRDAFIRAPDMPARQKAVEALHRRLWEVQPYLVVGVYDPPYAWRKNISGVLPATKLVLWNIDKN